MFYAFVPAALFAVLSDPEVMKYIDSSKLATAYIHGTMFDYGTWYRSWMAGEPIDIDSVETRPFSITFADLPVIHN